MRTKKHLFATILFAVFLQTGCGIKKDISDGSVIDRDCDFAIRFFNTDITKILKSDIAYVYRQNGNSFPRGLEDLYPEGQAAWNRELRDIVRGYRHNLNRDAEVIDDRYLDHYLSSDLPKYQQFFLLLYESKRGPYPRNSTDMERIAAWKQKSTMSGRLRGALSAFSSCSGNSADQIKAKLSPKFLPDKIEDCLK